MSRKDDDTKVLLETRAEKKVQLGREGKWGQIIDVCSGGREREGEAGGGGEEEAGDGGPGGGQEEGGGV